MDTLLTRKKEWTSTIKAIISPPEIAAPGRLFSLVIPVLSMAGCSL
jgi:hypothetical protein